MNEKNSESSLQKEHWKLVRGARASDIEALLQREGINVKSVEHTEITEIAGAKNDALTTKDLPWHNDRLYRQVRPDYMALLCEQAPKIGGRTLLMDGEKAARDLISEHPELQGVVLTYTKLGGVGKWPLIGTTRTGEPALWYRQELPGRPRVSSFDGVPGGIRYEDLMVRMKYFLSKREPTYEHTWQPGDLLIVDNLAMLHKREAYEGPRRLERTLVFT